MKNSIIILGITLVTLTNACKAANYTTTQQANYLDIASIPTNETVPTMENSTFAKPSLNEVDQEIFNPETVIAYTTKTINEVILQNDKIIENTNSDEIEFLAFEDTMNDIIAQNDLIIENNIANELLPLENVYTIYSEITQLEIIIESTVSNEVRPLNFKEINKNTVLQNNINSKPIAGMN